MPEHYVNAVRCPLCRGTAVVAANLYDASANEADRVPCQSCDATGLIVISHTFIDRPTVNYTLNIFRESDTAEREGRVGDLLSDIRLIGALSRHA